MKSKLIITSVLSLALLQCAVGQIHRPPSRPSVAPFIGNRYANDKDGDRIDDQLLGKAQAKVGKMVYVELIFKEPVTQRQIDTFEALGGEITYMYRAVSYGWNARIPLNKVTAVPAAMGATLLVLNEAQPGQAQMDEATRAARVRPVWTAGFAENPSGFSGNTNITIAVLDSGVDESHADLTGRRVYWHDFTASSYASPTDYNGHGSHVAGIALGTGAAGGVSGPLFFTQFDDLYRNGTLNVGDWAKCPVHLPTNSSTFSMTAQWLGGGVTTFNRYSRTNGTTTTWSTSATVTATSPQTLTTTTVFNPSRGFSPGLTSMASPTVSNFVITAVVSNYPAIDSFNRLRGVAPGCNWAGAKVISDTGSYLDTDVGAAIDDLVSARVTGKIKVMNLSLGGALNPALRQKINTAVNNGIVVTVAAGNRSTAYGTGITEPGRAALALTVAAANDINQLTDYSCQGFTSPNTATPGQEEDYKPDLMAPGGSQYHSLIMSVDSNNGDGPAFADQRTNDYRNEFGTSMASPFAAGAAALVIEAMERTGVTWDFNSSTHSRYVKMLLCATASESNTNRELNANSPTLQRASSITNGVEILPAGKDLQEGYGMLNADAAVEAVSLNYTNGAIAIATLGPSSVTDRRTWARTVNLEAGRNFSVTLNNPANADFDLYLYSATPTAYGTPVLLASSVQEGTAVNELLNYQSATDQRAVLVVKRVSGSGSFNLIGNAAPVVDFVADVISGLAPLTVNFTNLSTDLTNQIWSFGDGNTSTTRDASNTYASAGTYTVTLIAIGPGGTNSLTKEGLVLVTNALPPTVDFAATPLKGFAPLTVYFTNLSSGATNFLWSFNDGNTTTDANPINIYTNAGVYAVDLVAVGLGGTNTLTRANYIVVSAPPLILSATANGYDFTFSFETILGKTYAIQFKDSLDDPWQTWDSIPGDGTIHTVTNSISLVPQRFFRLNVE